MSSESSEDAFLCTKYNYIKNIQVMQEIREIREIREYGKYGKYREYGNTGNTLEYNGFAHMYVLRGGVQHDDSLTADPLWK
jgi:hypothetical protein